MLDPRTCGRKVREERDEGPLVPFKELVNESEGKVNFSTKQKEDPDNRISDDCLLPDPCNLLKVTNRRKMPQKKKTLPMVRTFISLPLPSDNFFLLLCHAQPFSKPTNVTPSSSLSQRSLTIFNIFSFRRTMNYTNCRQNMRNCF